MYAQAVIEIVPDDDGQLPFELLLEAYRASAQGLIVLALRDIGPGEVDLVLDHAVHLMPLSIPGVLYVDADEEKAVREALRTADTVFAATDRFRSQMEALGTDPRKISPVGLALKAMKSATRRPQAQAELPAIQTVSQKGLPPLPRLQPLR